MFLCFGWLTNPRYGGAMLPDFNRLYHIDSKMGQRSSTETVWGKCNNHYWPPLLLKHKVPVTLKYCSASATLVGNTLLMKRPNVLVPIHSADSLALKININKLETKQPIWKINHKSK